MYSNSAFEAIDAAHAFNHFGLDLPEDASHWVQRLTELRANRPEAPPRNAVATLIVDEAQAADIDQAIAAHLGNSHRVQQHSEAESIAGQRALTAIRADRDRLHSELRFTADQIIERLHQAAAIDESITDLTRARRVDEAHVLACANSDAVEPRDAYQLRDNYLTPPGSHWSTGWWDCGWYSNPWDIGNGNADHDRTLWGALRANIRAGGRLWFPTLEEAHAASEAHEPNMTTPIDARRDGAVFTGKR
jgi:hypothetical protein